MTQEELEVLSQRNQLKYDTAKMLRKFLDDSRGNYNALDIDGADDDFEVEVLRLAVHDSLLCAAADVAREVLVPKAKPKKVKTLSRAKAEEMQRQLEDNK